MTILDFLIWLAKFLFSSGPLVVSLLVGGAILWYSWRTARAYSEKGGVMFWALLFRWVFFVLIALSVLGFIWVMFVWSPGITQWVFDRAAESRDASAAIKLPSLEPNKNASTMPNLNFGGGILTPNAPTTGLQTVTLPADVAEVYPQAVKLALAPGVNEVQLYDRAGNPIQKVKKDITACGRAKSGHLIGCPIESGPLFSPLQVNWQAAGLHIELPTAVPTVKPTMSPDQLLKICEQRWTMWWNGGKPLSKADGYALVPKGIRAEFVGPGVGRAVGGKYKLSIIGFPSAPAVTLDDSMVSSVQMNPLETLRFTGTGIQCGQ